MEFLTANAWILWIAVIIMFLMIEAATVGLTSIWFALGGLAAMIASLLGRGWRCSSSASLLCPSRRSSSQSRWQNDSMPNISIRTPI